MRCEEVHKEKLDGNEVLTNNHKLQSLVEQIVCHEYAHTNHSIKWMRRFTSEASHPTSIENDTPSRKESTVHPSSSLFDQDH
jgi:hypothetical protein